MKFNKILLAALAMVLTSSFAMAKDQSAAEKARAAIEKQDQILVSLQTGLSKARRERNNAVMDLAMEAWQSIAYGIATKAMYKHSEGNMVFPKTARGVARFLEVNPQNVMYYPMEAAAWVGYNAVRVTGWAVIATTAGMTVVQIVRATMDTVTIAIDIHQISGFKSAIEQERVKLGTSKKALEAAVN